MRKLKKFNDHSVYLRVVFITMIVACILATNQGRLLFTVGHLTKLILYNFNQLHAFKACRNLSLNVYCS